MLRKLIVLLNIFFLLQEGTSNPRVRRIVNGKEEVLGDYPYQASLQLRGSIYCGATILDETHILTAAHCVNDLQNDSWNVIVGSVNLNKFLYPAQNHSVKSISVHDGYKYGNGFKNDIAILTLSSSIEFNDYVQPAKLPAANEDLKSGQTAVVTGFGRTADTAELSPYLFKAKVYIVDRTECQKSYQQDKVRVTNLCARNNRHITGYCRGDSGGPLTVNGKVVGIVSFALDNACATEHKYPQVYTRVSEYMDWIQSFLGN